MLARSEASILSPPINIPSRCLCLKSTAWEGQVSISADQGGAKASPSVSVSVTIYSGISEQRTLWDQYKFKWFVPCIEVVLFKRFQSHYIDRGINFGDSVLSIVERYLIQCPFLRVSVKRDSTVYNQVTYFAWLSHLH